MPIQSLHSRYILQQQAKKFDLDTCEERKRKGNDSIGRIQKILAILTLICNLIRIKRNFQHGPFMFQNSSSSQ